MPEYQLDKKEPGNFKETSKKNKCRILRWSVHLEASRWYEKERYTALLYFTHDSLWVNSQIMSHSEHASFLLSHTDLVYGNIFKNKLSRALTGRLEGRLSNQCRCKCSVPSTKGEVYPITRRSTPTCPEKISIFFLLLTSPSFSSDFRSLHDCYPTTEKHVWKVIGSDRWTYSEIKLSLWYYWQEVTKSKIKTDRMLLSCFCSFFFFPSRKHKEGRKAGKQGHCLYFEFPHFGQCVLNLQPVLWM